MKTRILILAAGLAIAATALPAQEAPPKGDVIYHQSGALVGSFTGPQVMVRMLGPEGLVGRTVTGKPLSATEERHTLQVLGDGTRIEQTDSNLFYRDDQGRTRIERTAEGTASVVIQDPVAGFLVVLDPATKVARKSSLQQGTFTAAAMPPSAGAAGMARMETNKRTFTWVAGGPGTVTSDVMIHRTETNMPQPSVEDLGWQDVNGVTAQGTRTTLRIPAGQIGNDRPIQTVNERWFSSELGMMVKSSNSDPRFGDTSYQLTNIQRTPPAPSLFQIPADYTVQALSARPAASGGQASAEAK